MKYLDQVIHEIHRHKGVLLDDDYELARYSEELFIGGAEILGVKRQDVQRSAVQEFTLNKYEQVLDYTKNIYAEQPEKREFFFRPKWSVLGDLQLQLAQQYRDGK